MPRLRQANRSQRRSTTSPDALLPSSLGQARQRGQQQLGQSIGSAFSNIEGYRERVDNVDERRQTIESRIAYRQAMDQYDVEQLNDTDYATQGERWAKRSQNVTNEVATRIKNPNALQNFHDYSAVETTQGFKSTERNAAMRMIDQANQDIIPYTQISVAEAAATNPAKTALRDTMRDRYVAEVSAMAVDAQISEFQRDAMILKYDSLLASADKGNRAQAEASSRSSILSAAQAVDEEGQAQELITNMGLELGMSNSNISWLQAEDRARRVRAEDAKVKQQQDNAVEYTVRFSRGGAESPTSNELILALENGDLTQSQFTPLMKRALSPVLSDDPEARTEMSGYIDQVGNNTMTQRQAKNHLTRLTPLLKDETIGGFSDTLGKTVDASKDLAYSKANDRAKGQIIKTQLTTLDRMILQLAEARESGAKNAEELAAALVSAQEERMLQLDNYRRFEDSMQAWRQNNPDASPDQILIEGNKKVLRDFSHKTNAQLRAERAEEIARFNRLDAQEQVAAANRSARATEAVVADFVGKDFVPDHVGIKIEAPSVDLRRGAPQLDRLQDQRRQLRIPIGDRRVQIILPNGTEGWIPLKNLKQAIDLGARRKQ